MHRCAVRLVRAGQAPAATAPKNLRRYGHGVAQIVARNGGRLPAIDRIGLRRGRPHAEGGRGERENNG